MKLSIIMMAFNQCQYINEAIESVVSQDLPQNWELLIGDDQSSDNTQEVVNKWMIKFPNNIKYYRHQNNIGLHRNYEFLISKSKGEFIALLEADDYWIQNDKCFKQIEFLEKHKNVSWCFTNGRVVDKNGEILSDVELDAPEIFNLEYYLQNFFNPLNNSIVFRKEIEPEEYPDFFLK